MPAHVGPANDPWTVHWIVEGVNVAEDGSWRSDLASNRYRTLMPARWLTQQGHRVGCVAQHKWRADLQALPDVAVIGKLRPYGDDPTLRQRIGRHVLQQVGVLRRGGAAVVADFCDDHFDHATLGDYWCGLAASVDLCVAGSRAMGTLLGRHTASPVHLIGDPLAAPPGKARVFRAAPGLTALQLVWYGDPSQWSPMSIWAERLAPLRHEQPFVLSVVTRPDPALLLHARQFSERFAPHARMEVIAWSVAAQWTTVEASDLVLVPVDLAEPGKRVKSGNRLTDALQAGRYVIASPLDAYEPYRDHVTLTDAPLEALRDYLADPDRALERLRGGQCAARVACSDEVIGRAWGNALAVARSLAARGGRIVSSNAERTGP